MPFWGRTIPDPLDPETWTWGIDVLDYVQVGYTAIDINGNTSSHGVRLNKAVDDGDVIDMVEEIFDQSYAGCAEIRITRVIRPENMAQVKAMDDTAGNLARVLTLNFSGESQGEPISKSVEIPAPHPGLLDSGGAFNNNATRSSGLLTDIREALNNGPISYAYKAATTGQRKYNLKGRTRVKTVQRPDGEEPGTIPDIDEDGSPS